ncbi:hypothetical protein D3C80_1319070 [compost metagenome]
MVHQHAVAAIGEIERDIFIRLFSAGAAVAVPGFDGLAVTHQRRETLSKTVHRFAHAQIQTLKHIITVGVAVLHVAVIFELTAGDPLPVTQEIQRPGFAFGHPRADASAFQLGKFCVVLDLHVYVFQNIERIMRAVIQRALEMLDAHADDPFLRSKQAHRKHQGIELPGALAHVTRRHVHHKVVALLLHVKHLYRIRHVQTRLNEPVSITDFHLFSSWSLSE